jgi:hypothetical protein
MKKFKYIVFTVLILAWFVFCFYLDLWFLELKLWFIGK